MARKKNQITLIRKKLKKYIQVLTKAVKVDKMILFGSYANGSAHEFSDIDIALVSSELSIKKPTFNPNPFAVESLHFIQPVKIPKEKIFSSAKVNKK